jgi:hypothetical protein
MQAACTDAIVAATHSPPMRPLVSGCVGSITCAHCLLETNQSRTSSHQAAQLHEALPRCTVVHFFSVQTAVNWYHRRMAERPRCIALLRRTTRSCGSSRYRLPSPININMCEALDLSLSIRLYRSTSTRTVCTLHATPYATPYAMPRHATPYAMPCHAMPRSATLRLAVDHRNCNTNSIPSKSVVAPSHALLRSMARSCMLRLLGLEQPLA